MYCADCPTRACMSFEELPEGCTSKLGVLDAREQALSYYAEPEIHTIVRTAAEVVGLAIADHWPRVREIVTFANKVGAKRIGIASCSSFAKEAGVLTDILEQAGFEVIDAMCRIGSLRNVEVGAFDAENKRANSASCNPFMQAHVLNQAKTDFNIILGLCLGHDMIFARNSEAWVTTLAVKNQSRTHAEIIGDELEAYRASME